MSTGKIFAQIPKIMGEVGAISKGRSNSAQGYKFRGIDDMYQAIHPVLVKNGVFCVPQVLETYCDEGETKAGTTTYHIRMRVNHKFYAEDGSFIEVITAGEGLDSSDKASNKAMSAAMKYAFIELLSIPTEDVADSDRDSPEAGKRKTPIYADQPPEGSHVEDVGYRIPFGKWARRSLEDVPAEELLGYRDYIVGQLHKKNETPKPQVAEFLSLSKNHLEALGYEVGVQ